MFGYCVASSFTYGLNAKPVPMMTSYPPAASDWTSWSRFDPSELASMYFVLAWQMIPWEIAWFMPA